MQGSVGKFLFDNNLQSYLTFQCKCVRIGTSKEITPEKQNQESHILN